MNNHETSYASTLRSRYDIIMPVIHFLCKSIILRGFNNTKYCECDMQYLFSFNRDNIVTRDNTTKNYHSDEVLVLSDDELL